MTLRAFGTVRLRPVQTAFLLAAIWAFVLTTDSRNAANGSPTLPNLENKCGDCPCDSPCKPPPSPPRPPPPPPPPEKKPSPTNNCPPPLVGGGCQNPPSPPYAYINGPPGSVYSVYPYHSGSVRGRLAPMVPFFVAAISSYLLAT